MDASVLHLKCEVIVPDTNKPTRTFVNRWSDIALHRPGLIVIPSSEDDILDAIRYAKQNGLTIVTAGGGTSPAVPLHSKTLYLDLKNLDQVMLDKDAETIKFGGGVSTEQMVETCTSQGFYTTWANSNVVGMTGSFLGGGNVLCVRLITASGQILEVRPSSQGEDLALFNAICGAGFGFGVIVSTTMRVFPISSLAMDNDEVWSRRLVFPAKEIELAANTYHKVQPLDPALVTVLMFMRGPPTSPYPGSPVVVISASYYGPHKKAEKTTAILFEEHVVGKAVQAVTTTIPLARMNDAMAPLSSRGDYKDIASAWLRTTSVETIQAAFQEWMKFTNKHDDAKRYMVVHATHNPERSMSIAEQRPGQSGYFDSRDRGTCLLLFSWATMPEMIDLTRDFVKKIKTIYRKDQGSDLPRTFANNLQSDTKLDEIYTMIQIEELECVKSCWNSDGLLWCPIGDQRHSN